MAYKVILIGDSGVGKSRLLFSGEDSDLTPKETVGMEFKNMKIEVHGKKRALHVWDTSGQERFRSLVPQYYRDADGAVVVYDVTRRETFLNVSMWVKDVKMYAKEDVAISIVGNKTDQETRQVGMREGSNYAANNKYLFGETSAFCDAGIRPVLEDLMLKMMSLHDVHPKVQPGTIHLSSDTFDVALQKERSWFEKCCW